MSQEPKSSHAGEVDPIRLRIEDVRREMSRRIERSERRRKAWLVGGATAAMVCAISLSVFTAMSFELDATALSEIGRGQVELSLPLGRERLKSYLESNAPQLVSSVISVLLDALPTLRPLVLRELDRNTRALTADFEEKLLQETGVAVRAARARIDADVPGATDREKLEKLVAWTAQEFNKNVDALLQEMYPQFAAEIERVRGRLVMLRDADASTLSEAEKREKEIIETLLRLIVRENAPKPSSKAR